MPNMLGDIVEHVLNAYPAARIETRRALTDNPIAEASRAGAQLLVVRDGDPLLQRFAHVPDLAMLALDEAGHTGMLTMLHREPIALDCDGLERIAGLLFRERVQG